MFFAQFNGRYAVRPGVAAWLISITVLLAMSYGSYAQAADDPNLLSGGGGMAAGDPNLRPGMAGEAAGVTEVEPEGGLAAEAAAGEAGESKGGEVVRSVVDAAAGSVGGVEAAEAVRSAVAEVLGEPTDAKAVVITVKEMIDEGLYESIKRRTDAALAAGATYIIYEVDTFGGRLDSATSIWDYFMHTVNPKAHTVAYIPTKAISAGILISVACEDIVMKKATMLGDSAPISGTGVKIEGVEREKVESPTRGYFRTAAEANGYPPALCEAMVTMTLEVYSVENRETGEVDYYVGDDLPTDPCAYDLENKKLIVGDDELLTANASEALEYGISRGTVDDLDGSRSDVLEFLEQRDNVRFAKPIEVLETNWSEQVVRWLTSPAVTGVLFMIALLGIYAELNSPGLGLPGAIAVIALAVLFGSKFLIGMANWWEIAVFVLGMALLLLEIFVIPGFGVAGISGLLLMVFALAAIMIGNPPDKLPIPQTDWDWDVFKYNMLGMLFGFIGFLVGAYFLTRFLPRIPFANRLVLEPVVDSAMVRMGVNPAPAPEPTVKRGDVGVTANQLRPSGMARFGVKRIDVVTQGELVEAGRKIKVVGIEGNSIVVQEIAE